MTVSVPSPTAALPTILSLTLSYQSAEPLAPSDLLSLYLTLPDTFALGDLFDLPQH
jgi:hypothetical protein